MLGRDELDSARTGVDPDVLAAIELAASNVKRVAESEVMAELRVTLPQGQSVRLRSVPVGAAGAYAPGGTASYPSSALMCCVPARTAGVERVAVATPPDPDGRVDPAILAAAAVSGADAVYATGGVQAIAALALGTESIEPVDVIVGPGNRYVQEAKRQLAGRVGIDGVAGPSELMVIFDSSAELRWLALDLCAQGEHGDDGLLVAASDDAEALGELERLVAELAGARDTVTDPPLALVEAPSPDEAIVLGQRARPRAPADRLRARPICVRQHRGLRVRGQRQCHRVRRLRRRFEPRSPHGRRGALHGAARADRLQAAHRDRAGAAGRRP